MTNKTTAEPSFEEMRQRVRPRHVTNSAGVHPGEWAPLMWANNIYVTGTTEEMAEAAIRCAYYAIPAGVEKMKNAPQELHVRTNVKTATETEDFATRLEALAQAYRDSTPGELGYDLNGRVATVEWDGEWGDTVCILDGATSADKNHALGNFMALAHNMTPEILERLQESEARDRVVEAVSKWYAVYHDDNAEDGVVRDLVDAFKELAK